MREFERPNTELETLASNDSTEVWVRSIRHASDVISVLKIQGISS
jgi:hypothetical protein